MWPLSKCTSASDVLSSYEPRRALSDCMYRAMESLREIQAVWRQPALSGGSWRVSRESVTPGSPALSMARK